ncbi:hypothetical protein L345_03878, partial [Ophiophagus hannah]
MPAKRGETLCCSRKVPLYRVDPNSTIRLVDFPLPPHPMDWGILLQCLRHCVNTRDLHLTPLAINTEGKERLEVEQKQSKT